MVAEKFNMDKEDQADLILSAMKTDESLEGLTIFTDIVCETAKEYDGGITKEHLEDYLEYAKENLLPGLYVNSAITLHAHLDRYNEKWKEQTQEKKDIRQYNFDELVIEYAGSCFNGIVGSKFVIPLAGKDKKTYKHYESMLEKVIRETYKQNKEIVAGEYEKFLEKEKESFSAYV
ncbi:MAG: hypothetical protein KAU95_04715 [Candidatus Aenigmarchaeota archaeon]|nr:hypothetical protein [Candidatus Aenigmarchaeota archaeon]